MHLSCFNKVVLSTYPGNAMHDITGNIVENEVKHKPINYLFECDCGYLFDGACG